MLRLFALLAWLATLLLGTAPLLIGADSGGVLPWTQWAAAILCLTAIGLTVPDCLVRRQPGAWPRHTLAVLLLLLAGYGFLQAAPLPSGMVTSVAPGSAAAYSAWLSPLSRVPEDAQLLEVTRPRISVDVTLTRSAAWLSVLIAGFAWLASYLFVDRSRLQFLLTVLAITGAIHAGLGLYQLFTAADATVWGIRSYHGGKPFGAFINRSNATVMLNLGLAASLGLIGWRLAALTGTPLNGERFPYNELLDVAFDRLSVLAFCTASVSLVGLLICGSRSGLVGLVGGLMLAFGMVQSANKLRGMLATAVGLGLMVAIVMVNIDLTALSADRLGATAEDILETATLQDARFPHWRDGFSAAIHQPATGWGWGAYRYAYLPFQKTSSGAWFVNADNLWLELFVETGLVGMALLAVGLWVIIRALSNLALSVDPIDHGLVIAGWFALGALTTSQFFDFGLRIPANSIMAAILFSVVIARSYSAGSQDTTAKSHRGLELGPRLWLLGIAFAKDSRGSRFGSVSLVAVYFLSVLAAADAFAWQARGDKAIRMARLLPRDNRMDLQAAELISASLLEYLIAIPRDSEALKELSRLETDRARIGAVRKIAQSADDRSVDEILVSLSRRNLRKLWYRQANPNGEPLFSARHHSASDIDSWMHNERTGFNENVQRARRFAIASLLASPLSPEARFTVLTLDFSGGAPGQSAEFLQQTASLQKQNPHVLLYVGDLAADAADWPFAASTWQRAVYLNANLTTHVLSRLPAAPSLRPNDVIPNAAAALRIAATTELRKQNPDHAMLTRAIDALNRSLPADKIASSNQLRLVARIQMKLAQPEDAALTLMRATTIHPRDVELQFEYASALLKIGKFTEAKQAARVGQQLAPEHPQLEKLFQNFLHLAEPGSDSAQF